MTDQLSPLAVQNAGLLRAIRRGPAETPGVLAQRAGIGTNNLHRKLDSLEAEGLIRPRAADAPKHLAELTEPAERALVAIDVYEGRLAAGEVAPLTAGGISFIPLSRLRPWPGNPRKFIPPHSIREMAQSVADRGVETPITVRALDEGFEVLFGQRRYLGTIDAVGQGWVAADALVPCQVRELSDQEAEEAAGVENLQREDMHWADLAQYFRHMMDDRRLTGPQLERLFGGRNYSARKIQDYAKIARELASDVFALAYEPEFLDAAEKQRNPKHLTYTKARDLVGDKQERPALDLTPKLRLALLELIMAGEQEGRTVITRLHAPPNGGPLIALQDRKLIGFGFAGREVVCRIPVTDDLGRFLQQIGWYEDEAAALRAARVALAGDLQTDALEPGEYLTPELNAPKATAPIAPDPADDVSLDGADDEEDPQPILRDPAGQLVEADAEQRAERDVAPPALLADHPPLPPMLQMVLIELAHRIASRGRERSPGSWAAEVQSLYYKDQRGMQLVQQHRMIAFVPTGLTTAATITRRGFEWLDAHICLAYGADGRPNILDRELADQQQRLGFKGAGGQYSTPWLNDPEPEPKTPEPEPPQPAPTTAAPPPGRDVFAQQILAVTAEARVIGRMAAALREARTTIRSGRSAKLAAARADQIEALIDSALDAAAPHLIDDPQHDPKIPEVRGV